jgi:hypothetical protein
MVRRGAHAQVTPLPDGEGFGGNEVAASLVVDGTGADPGSGCPRGHL